MPDFYAQIITEDKTIYFQDALLDLFNKMLKEAGIVDTDKLGVLARMRARIEIDLKDF